jgi:hypothetical protein
MAVMAVMAVGIAPEVERTIAVARSLVYRTEGMKAGSHRRNLVVVARKHLMKPRFRCNSFLLCHRGR